MPSKATAEFIETDLIEEREAEVDALTQPDRDATTPILEAITPVDWERMRAMIDEAVAQKNTAPAPMGTVPVALATNVDPRPPSFKKHYRCDVTPELQIQRLDMNALDRGERPQANALPGEWIKFRMGHHYTSNDNDIRQIEWMRTRSGHSADGSATMGGNRSIYESDGGDVYHCTAGCRYETASKNAWISHMWVTHEMEVGN